MEKVNKQRWESYLNSHNKTQKSIRLKQISVLHNNTIFRNDKQQNSYNTGSNFDSLEKISIFDSVIGSILLSKGKRTILIKSKISNWHLEMRMFIFVQMSHGLGIISDQNIDVELK